MSTLFRCDLACSINGKHIIYTEMKVLMKGIVNRLYTFMMQGDDPHFDKNMDYHKRFTRTWDEPEIDEKLDCNQKNEDME